MNRNEAIWYYRLGGQTLGPVSWNEIEDIIRGGIDAEDLLVARGGDAAWSPAADVLAEHPDLQESGAGEFEIEPEPAEETLSDESWQLLDEEPSEAASEVLNEAAAVRHSGRAVSRGPVASTGADAGAGGMPRVHGLGPWIGQAWTMVSGNLLAFALGVLLAGVVGILSIGILAPPLGVGIYVMALKAFRGEPISPGTVFEGLQYFLPAWGVALLIGLAGFVLTAPLSIPALILAEQGGDEAMVAMLQMISNVWGQIVGLVISGAMFYALVLLADRGLGTMDAIKGSWEATKPQLASYIGMAFVLQLIGGAGMIACCVGLLITAPMVPCAEVAAYMYHFRNV